MLITVLIPTYHRPHDLERCLNALKQQTRLANEVMLVVRDTDNETWTFLEEFDKSSLPLRIVTVKVPGVVAAMNAGVDAAKGEIIALTDDDAAPHPDWLDRIESHFVSDSRIGAVGGRDWIYINAQLIDGAYSRVGQVRWFGQLIGNHHAGVGQPREVDMLKGVNSSYRRVAIQGIRFDERMRGAGAQVHWELAFDLALKRAGWKIIYDPKVAVDHFIAQRFDEDQRNSFNRVALVNMAHNETLILLEHFSPIRRIVFLVWAMLIGTRSVLGLVQLLRLMPSERGLAVQKWVASVQGRWAGWRTWQQSQLASFSRSIVSPKEDVSV